MAITQADFDKIWASTSPLTPYEFSEANYKEGWNFVGDTPPSRQMWDFLQKQNDEKSQWLYLNVVQGIPIGVVQAYAGNTVPDGWLLCDGSAISRTDYAELYAVIGDTYGAGDGSTTFNLPNLVDKFVEGSATSGTVKGAGLPNIVGSVTFRKSYSGTSAYAAIYDNTGSLVDGGDGSAAGGNELSSQGGGAGQKLNIDASRSNAIYGSSDTVQPPALTMQYIIKY